MSTVRWSALACCAVFAAATASAQTPRGFQLSRHEPTSAGAWFLAVDRPFYNSYRAFAVGLTLGYAHNLLVAGPRDRDGSFTPSSSVIEHQLTGHVDLAGALWDRVHLSAMLPLVLLERGTPTLGVVPLDAIVVGDPRLGAFLRLWGQPDRDRFSIHLGAYFWIPFGNDLFHAGDAPVRALPKLVLAGIGGPIRWAVNAGFLLRPTASLGQSPDGVGNTVGSELQLAVAAGWTSADRRLNLGPEVTFATVVADGRALQRDFTSLEVLASVHYLVADQLLLGIGGGLGLLREPGTPDGRLVVRLAWAPIAGVKPKPQPQPAAVVVVPDRNDDRDDDGVVDLEDQCPEVAAGLHPDLAHEGCPLADSDGDGRFDPDDRCPREAAGASPDPSPDRKGCPRHD